MTGAKVHARASRRGAWRWMSAVIRSAISSAQEKATPAFVNRHRLEKEFLLLVYG